MGNSARMAAFRNFESSLEAEDRPASAFSSRAQNRCYYCTTLKSPCIAEPPSGMKMSYVWMISTFACLAWAIFHAANHFFDGGGERSSFASTASATRWVNDTFPKSPPSGADDFVSAESKESSQLSHLIRAVIHHHCQSSRAI